MKKQLNHEHSLQQGFVILLVIVVISIIAALWLSTKHYSLISVFKTNDIQADSYELELVKKRLLEYAVLHPEIYTTDDSGSYQNSAQIPAPGYFPCPDLDGDGDVEGAESSCSNPFTPGGTIPDEDNTGFVPSGGVLGFVPESISTHRVHFAEAGRYYYFLDERFSTQNPAADYINDALQKYAPMNPTQFVGDVSAATDNLDAFEPVLTLNGKTGYIALIIDAGDDGLDAANNVDASDGLVDRHFISRASDLSDDPNADKIVGITMQDLDNAINRRLCVERFRYEGLEYADEDGDGSPDEINPFSEIAVDLKHWYNDYVYTTLNDPNNNAGGANWRSTDLKCKYEY
ncbi:hypothetical protein THMIRHAM_18190 [Thiomicrorhabdus immobilis]|uniref:Type II secretion system protein n=1 Tax=Thiomicrorhabdus immobilis TaxID=2791037 RepID=A0ABN6CZE4_9GAMM|nr:hypothetical protein [Thiomicrorhabdus immobilis]BCN94034.1 hypothetical protein THMIRHAM_18190 [Thiomicrorhabdus immobilis]